jgi:hypothetical protein
MAKTVVGLFDSYSEAQHVVQDLIDGGFNREDISVVSNDSTHSAERERMVGTTSTTGTTDESAAADGAGTGAVSGTVLGGALGLLVGAGLLAIPGIGPVLAAGPLAAGIGTIAATVGAGALGAGIGAATGGLMGGLVGAGVPKEDAEHYAEGVRRGGTLVTVNAEDSMASTAHDVLQRHNAIDIDERSTQWRSSGWTGFDDKTEPLDRSGATGMAGSSMAGSSMAGSSMAGSSVADSTTMRGEPMVSGEIRRPLVGMGDTAMNSGIGSISSYDTYDTDYRDHYQRTFSSAGYTYDDYKPVYQYGYSLAGDQRYSGNDWSTVETDARTRWEEHNPGTWEQFKDSIQYAWDKARGKR